MDLVSKIQIFCYPIVKKEYELLYIPSISLGFFLFLSVAMGVLARSLPLGMVFFCGTVRYDSGLEFSTSWDFGFAGSLNGSISGSKIKKIGMLEN